MNRNGNVETLGGTVWEICAFHSRKQQIKLVGRAYLLFQLWLKNILSFDQNWLYKRAFYNKYFKT